MGGDDAQNSGQGPVAARHNLVVEDEFLEFATRAMTTAR